jgi:hypothetical protein
MATYTLISSNVLASSAVSVTFSAIPSTYTDLEIRISARSNDAQTYGRITMRFNGSEVANYSRTRLFGYSTTATSSRDADDNGITQDFVNGNSATANTFGSMQIYIPSYTSSNYKPVSSFGVSESNATTEIYRAVTAGLWRDTSAITSILLRDNSGANWLSGSSFYLYGISNA